MRVRKKPWASQELLDNNLVINDAPEKKGKWREYFGNDNPIYVEIGCGTVLNPGTVVGRNSNVYPLSSVRGVVP